MARILQPTPENLDILAAALSAGEIVAVPTETVYGLAGNALNPRAVAKIYEAKGRPAKNPLIVHIVNRKQLNEIAEVPDAAEMLFERWWPGPLTLIFKKKARVPDSVTAGRDTVAVRMPAHPVFQELARRCSFPLAAPSANPSGYVSPTKAEHVQTQMGEHIDWILDGGSCDKGIESTILSLVDPQKPVILRHGSISADQLASSLETPLGNADLNQEGVCAALLSPGLMKRHYSPKTPVRLFQGSLPHDDGRSAILFLSQNSCRTENHFGLSKEGDLSEVARNLYDQLQKLDAEGFGTLFIELPENSGAGVAIRDRMTRAAAGD